MKKFLATFFTAVMLSPASQVGLAATDGKLNNLADQYEEVKIKAVAIDKASRRLLGSLYDVNKRMKKVSKKREELTNKMLSVRANSKDLAKEIVRLEKIINKQRVQLNERLKILYRLGGQGSVGLLFNTTNSHDFDRNLKFLKILSDHQYKFIKHYEKNVKVLGQQKIKFKDEVRSLASLQKGIKNQEKMLVKDEDQKRKLLENFRSERVKYVKRMKGIREKSENLNTGPFDDENVQSLMKSAFFEKKGQLGQPIEGRILQGYGLIYNDSYKYRLRHKGVFFAAPKGTSVLSVSHGRVAYAGDIPGYGKTVILDHGDNYYTVYGQNDDLKVKQGERVDMGVELAASGGGSKQYGHGLYFEIRHFSDAVDPQHWFGKSEVKAASQERTL